MRGRFLALLYPGEASFSVEGREKAQAFSPSLLQACWVEWSMHLARPTIWYLFYGLLHQAMAKCKSLIPLVAGVVDQRVVSHPEEKPLHPTDDVPVTGEEPHAFLLGHAAERLPIHEVRRQQRQAGGVEVSGTHIEPPRRYPGFPALNLHAIFLRLLIDWTAGRPVERPHVNAVDAIPGIGGQEKKHLKNTWKIPGLLPNSIGREEKACELKLSTGRFLISQKIGRELSKGF